jgi:anthranilate phosphoribosyltransferase
MLSGDVTPAQMGGFLMALRVRGEGVEEITGAVAAMRARMLRVNAPADAIDIVGTGGDGSGSYNVSTCASIIVAACGVPVAKHGNRAASSKSGSSDALAALGVRIGLPAEGVERCIAEAGIGFMMAPTHHAAMRHVGSARVELGTRTIFNLLGPLSNPAGVKRQVIGVFSSAWLEPMAKVLRNHGSERVWLCHGGDGLDEITTTAPTEIVELRNGEIRTFTIEPEDVGLRRAAPAELKGGDPATNAEALRAVLAGARNGYRDIALLNAAAALVVADRAQNLADGVRRAARAVDEGAAAATLAKLAEVSNA